MIRRATEVALLVDHSKFDRKAFVQLVDFSHINYLITNKAPCAEWIAFVKRIIFNSFISFIAIPINIILVCAWVMP